VLLVLLFVDVFKGAWFFFLFYYERLNKAPLCGRGRRGMYGNYRGRFRTFRRSGYGFSARPYQRSGFRMPRYRGRLHHLRSYRFVNKGWTRGFGGPSPHLPELKSYDTAAGFSLPITNTPANVGDVTSWTINYLFFPTQGADISNRIGRKCIIDKHLLRVLLKQNGGATVQSSSGFVRLLLIYDQQNNSLNSTATTQAAALLQTPTNLNSPMLLDNRERFKILADKYIPLGASATDAAGYEQLGTFPTENKMHRFKSKGLKLDVIFNGTNGGTNADIITGSIFLLMGTDVASDSGNGLGPVAAIWSRTRWHDC